MRGERKRECPRTEWCADRGLRRVLQTKEVRARGERVLCDVLFIGPRS